MAMLAVDFIYDDDCPNAVGARANLRTALGQVGLPESWSEHHIGAPAVTERARGYGSPTILIDGRDVAGVEPGADQCCRVYAGTCGAPPVDMIVRALQRVGARRPPLCPRRFALGKNGSGSALLRRTLPESPIRCTS